MKIAEKILEILKKHSIKIDTPIWSGEVIEASQFDAVASELQSLFNAEAIPLRGALLKIANWELPPTGRFWDDDESRPMSYGACYGSNGERDFFKSVALHALGKSIQP